MVGASIHNENKNTEVSLVAITETDLDVNVEKYEYTCMARNQMEKISEYKNKK
jgi:hypothetical protein